MKALEAQLEGREREVQALQMALHHCEMDVVRMRAVVDSVAQVTYTYTYREKKGMKDRKSKTTMAIERCV